MACMDRLSRYLLGILNFKLLVLLQIHSRNLKFRVPTSDQRYLKYFQPLKIIAWLEVYAT
jgi:hypothetical protein